MKKVLGIDNGLNGGLALVGGGEILRLSIMPATKPGNGKRDYLLPTIVKMIKDWNPDHAILEIAHAMPKQGLSSTFSTGRGFGLMEGILAALGIPYQTVKAVEWQGVMFQGLSNKMGTKERSAKVAMALWPHAVWTATERCKVPHDGMTDAACIAEYGRRLNNF